jgi:WD40 repeat protein/predicted Ser/Thr protein kinase
MADEQGDRVEVLFHRAADLPPDQRQALLDAACRGEPELRAAVEKLLADDARIGDDAGARAFLSSPLVRLATDTPTLGPALPARLGRYRVLRLLGEGGMGSVYEAEQDRPHRCVALKVIRSGLLSPALLKRFEQEVEILGRLRHPGIAQIHEAGIAEDGQPFFAMEFVRGPPLDEYARSRSLTVPDSFSLVARVCDAVQHAHDQGVIHRDLKPSNILVDETGQPKVLDFGVARATDADLLTGAGLTQTGQLLGTPSYMSPEQLASGSAIDHRADVYALGVILFELLAHRLPSEVANRPLAEVARLIVEEDAPRLGSINPELRGDVETIVAKALEKDRGRRYASAADLAADIRRWLAKEPILARPPSALYHLRQFARRHTALVAAVLSIGAALAAGTVVSVLYAVRADQNARKAAESARQATDEKHEAMFQEYRAHIAAAAAALTTHDVAAAAGQLDAAPKEFRNNWEWRHLHSRLDDSTEMTPLPGPEADLLVDAAGGPRFWVMTRTGLRLTELGGSHTRTLPIGPEHGRTVAVVQTGRGIRVVAAVGDTAVDLLDDASRVLCHIKTPQARRWHLAVSPDGRRLACVWMEGEWMRIGVFDATSGKQTAVCAGHRGGTIALAFSPDGTRLASGGEDRDACLWDAVSGALRATCRGHMSRVHSVAFRPDGARLLTASSDETVRQWDVATGNAVDAPYDRHIGEVYRAIYSPDGESVASTGVDRTIRVWRAEGRQDRAILHGHTLPATALTFAPDGRRLVSISSDPGLGGGDCTVRVWDVDPDATLPVMRGHTRAIYPVALSPDGRWIASGSWDGTVRLWDAVTGQPACRPLPHPGIVRTLAYGPDGSWLVTGGDKDFRLWVWDVATARVRKKVQGSDKQPQSPDEGVRDVVVSPDGARVATTAYVQLKSLLSVTELSSDRRLFAAPGRVLAYSPDGRWLAVTAADNRTVLLLDARTHQEVAPFRGHESHVNSAAFSRDSRRLATCGADRIVRVWQIDSGACQELRGHTAEVFAVAFHPDGTRLATGGRDLAVWLWDLARGEQVARLPGHTSFIWSLAFSPDGATLVSGSGDATVRLWDTAPLKERYKARRDAEALRPEAERLVEQLWRQKDSPAEVAAAIRADRALSEPLRHAALQAVMRRPQAREAVPGNPNGP